MNDLLDLIIKSETDGLDTLDEVIALAVGLVNSGLVNSTGSYGRYVDSVVDAYPDEFDAALDAVGMVRMEKNA
jgi:hypothetical protein